MRLHPRGKLKRLGVEVVPTEDDVIILACLLCGQQWVPELSEAKGLPDRYWLAPCGHNNLLTGGTLPGAQRYGVEKSSLCKAHFEGQLV